jgi:hypothetical protein
VSFTLDQELIAGREWEHPRSAIQSLTSPAPGAGFTVPTSGAVEQIIQSLSFVLVTSAAAANRIARVEFLDPDGTVFAAIASPFLQTASKTIRYTFAVGIQQFGANDAAFIGAALPPFKLDVSMSVRIAIGAVDTADQVSAASLVALRWPVRP